MLSMIQKIEFPWRQTVDAIEEVGTQESYATSIELSRAGIIGGPSSGLGYKGALQASIHSLKQSNAWKRKASLVIWTSKYQSKPWTASEVLMDWFIASSCVAISRTYIWMNTVGSLVLVTLNHM
jgi:hypothetical protein